MSNINQWKKDELPNSKIIITEEVFYRLQQLIGRTSWIASEHNSTLFGRKLPNQDIYLIDSVNENEDYISNGIKSENPYDYSVDYGQRQYNEMVSKINPGVVVIDVHTHPSGLIDDYRFISEGDEKAAKNLSAQISQKGGTAFSALIGCDRINGNMSFSIIWYNKLNDEFYRVPEIYLRQKDAYGNYQDRLFTKYGETQLIMQNWGVEDVMMPQSVKEELTGLKRR